MSEHNARLMVMLTVLIEGCFAVDMVNLSVVVIPEESAVADGCIGRNEDRLRLLNSR
jgi:hypothetical protein